MQFLREIAKRVALRSGQTPGNTLRGTPSHQQKVLRYVSQEASSTKYENGHDGTENRLTNVEHVCYDSGMYHLRWADGTVQKYPFVWLLENCRCPQCYHPSSYQRLFLQKDLEPEVTPLSENIDSAKATFYVTWPDGHTGEYPTDWLFQHRFDQTKYDPIADIKRRSWVKEDYEMIPTYEYNNIMEDDKTLFDWLKTIYVTGLSIVSNAPREMGVVNKIGKRVGHLRLTHYGDCFHVFNKPNASNVAYTCVELGLHVDLPFYTFCPGVQMLHCIQQTESYGGVNTFSDAYTVAEAMKKDNPYFFHLLTTYPIHFRDCGVDTCGEFHFQFGRPIIKLDSEGMFEQVFVNDGVRASFLDVPVDTVRDIYRAMKEFHQLINKEGNKTEIKLKSGDIAIFNNTRVMHGRSAYTSTPGSQQDRYFEGGYLDWDELYSKMRVLHERFYGPLRI